MASANNMVSPIHNWRPEEPYAENGSAELGWGSVAFNKKHGAKGVRFVQQPKRTKDIGEGGIDPEVHGMASANNMVSPIHNWRPEEPYAANGSAELGWGDVSLGQQPRRTKDIGEGGIDPEVHGMASANNMVSPIHNWRPEEPYDANGSAELGWGDVSFPQKERAAQVTRAAKDIGKDEVRPDVYTVVWNLVDPAPMPRAKYAPLEFDHPWDEVEHNLKMREIAALNYVDREDAALRYLRDKIAEEEEEQEARDAERNPTAFDEDMDAADAAAESHLPPPVPLAEDPVFPDEEESEESESSEEEEEEEPVEEEEEEEEAAEGEEEAALAKHGQKTAAEPKKHHKRVIQPDPVNGKLPKGVAEPLTKDQKARAKTHKKVEEPTAAPAEAAKPEEAKKPEAKPVEQKKPEAAKPVEQKDAKKAEAAPKKEEAKPAEQPAKKAEAPKQVQTQQKPEDAKKPVQQQ